MQPKHGRPNHMENDYLLSHEPESVKKDKHTKKAASKMKETQAGNLKPDKRSSMLNIQQSTTLSPLYPTRNQSSHLASCGKVKPLLLKKI